MKFINKKKLKYGSMSIVLSILFIVGIILINIIFGMVIDRFGTSIDLTQDKIYTIGDDTKQQLSSLNGEVNIYVLANEKEFSERSNSLDETYRRIYDYNQVNEMIKGYTSVNSNIKISYIDLIKNPNFANKYEEQIDSYQVIVESTKTKRYRVLDYLDFFAVGTDSYGNITSSSFTTEEALTSAIMYVTDENLIRVAISNGYDEVENASLESLIKSNGYQIEDIDLSLLSLGADDNEDAKIDEDIDIIIINGPAKDLSKSALDLIEKWLDNNGKFGKSLIYAATYNQTESPQIDAFLKGWGVEVPRSIVYQTSSDYASPFTGYLHYQNVPETDISAILSTSTPRVPVYYTRPVNVLFEEENNITTKVLLNSYDGAVMADVEKAINDSDYEPALDTNLEKGAFPTIVMSEKARYEGLDAFYSRVITLGGTNVLLEDFLVDSSYQNAELFVKTLNYISGKEDNITITGKRDTTPAFEITAAQKNMLTIIFVLVIPLIVIICGIVVWARRRHK
ncbi:MAG: hypothetical protein GX346_07430 [Clostridiales bacterium]|nr:hypothetical protein [Clostridiales bacterium]